MDKKTFENIKKRNLAIDDKMAKNNEKIKLLEEANKSLELEKTNNQSTVMNSVIKMLHLKPYEFMEEIFNGKKAKEILAENSDEIEDQLQKKNEDNSKEKIEDDEN